MARGFWAMPVAKCAWSGWDVVLCVSESRGPHALAIVWNRPKTSVRSAFVRNAALESNNLTITANAHGVVTLEGHVHTFDERRQAEHLAWYAPGVTAVHNRLKVRD